MSNTYFKMLTLFTRVLLVLFRVKEEPEAGKTGAGIAENTTHEGRSRFFSFRKDTN